MRWWKKHQSEVATLRSDCLGASQLDRLDSRQQQILFIGGLPKLTPTATNLLQLVLHALMERGKLGVCGGAERLGVQLGCDARSVQRAYALLQAEGLIELIPDVETPEQRKKKHQDELFKNREGRLVDLRERDAILIPTEHLLDLVENWCRVRRRAAFRRFRLLGTTKWRTVRSAALQKEQQQTTPDQSPVDSVDNSSTANGSEPASPAEGATASPPEEVPAAVPAAPGASPVVLALVRTLDERKGYEGQSSRSSDEQTRFRFEYEQHVMRARDAFYRKRGDA